MVDDPDRKEDDDENNGNGGNKDPNIPKKTLFFPDIDKEDELYKRLNESENKNNEDSCLNINAEKIGVNDDKIGCQG